LGVAVFGGWIREHRPRLVLQPRPGAAATSAGPPV